MEAAQAAFQAGENFLRVNSALYVLASAALIIIGVGLRRRQRWARRAALIWSLLGLVFLLVSTLATIKVLQPRQREARLAVYAAHDVSPPADFASALGTAALLFSSLLYAAYPVVLMVLLGRSSALSDFVRESS